MRWSRSTMTILSKVSHRCRILWEMAADAVGSCTSYNDRLYIWIQKAHYQGIGRICGWRMWLWMTSTCPRSETKKSASFISLWFVFTNLFSGQQKESRIIENNNNLVYLTSKWRRSAKRKRKKLLTDEQAARLLDGCHSKGLPPYVFVMLGLYAGFRREEILAQQWDSVYLDTDNLYLTVRRACNTGCKSIWSFLINWKQRRRRETFLPYLLGNRLREAAYPTSSMLFQIVMAISVLHAVWAVLAVYCYQNHKALGI